MDRNEDRLAPEGNLEAPGWGSDVVAKLLRQFDIPYLFLNPGASFRGLHDSVVNYLGNEKPELVLALHESQAVGMAHGYAKITGRPGGVVLHSNVGLMNGLMAIYNAWCDRAPLFILGATGVVDATKRRPWIEWIHTSKDQGALVRNFVKWDDQPASVGATVESMLRAWQLVRTHPHAPVYICMDVAMQEDALNAPVAIPDLKHFEAPAPAAPNAEALARAVELIKGAKRPLIAVGRVARTEQAWRDRIAFAEACGAAVVCDQKAGIGFPSAHPLFVGAPAQYLTGAAKEAMAEADLVIDLDWLDFSSLLRSRKDPVRTLRITHDHVLHNGWANDHFPLPPADVHLAVAPDAGVAALVKALAGHKPPRTSVTRPQPPEVPSTGPVTLPALAAAFDKVRGDRPVCLARLPFGWPDSLTRVEGPLDCIGYDGGGGLGSTPGIAVGAAMALKGTGRLPVALIGDGDLLMGSQALWTAAQRKLPLLFLVNNNRAFFNDVEHQELVAVRRRRPVERKYIGMEIEDPPVDLVGLARAYGCTALGPVTRIEELDAVLRQGFDAALAGATVVIDFAIPPGQLVPR